jgi:protein-arginine kinase activator protein McsA
MKGEINMTQELKETIIKLKGKGLGYKAISRETGVSLGTVKTTIRREEIKKESSGTCKCCGMTMKQTPGHRQKEFCSEKCRYKWWSSHPELRNRKAFYELKCLNCGKTFISYGNKNRKYCCPECFRTTRRKVCKNEQ